MARKKGHDQDGEPAPRVAIVEAGRPEETETPSLGHEEALFEALDIPEPDVPPSDGGMTPAQKREFVKFIHSEMSLQERAKRLAVLARLHGTKTAAVGLRAIIEMNLLDDMRKDQPTEDKPMFALPAESKPAIDVEEIEE